MFRGLFSKPSPRQIVNYTQIDNEQTIDCLEDTIVTTPSLIQEGVLQALWIGAFHRYVSSKDLGALVQTGKLFYHHFNKDLTKKAIRPLYEAVIDDNHKRVKAILNCHPELLLYKPQELFTVMSKHTWQTFIIEDDVLSVAVSRRQINMAKLLCGYYEKLPQDNETQLFKASALARWHCFQYRHSNLMNDLIIPIEYINLLNSIVDVFTADHFDNGITDQLSDPVSLCIQALTDRLLPSQPVKLAHLDEISLVIAAAYRVYINRFNEFTNLMQQEAYCIRIVGLLQSFVPTEMARVLCEGIYRVVMLHSSLGPRAHSLTIAGKAPYYPASPKRDGLGYMYCCHETQPLTWRGQLGLNDIYIPLDAPVIFEAFQTYCLNTDKAFTDLLHQTLKQNQRSMAYQKTR